MSFLKEAIFFVKLNDHYENEFIYDIYNTQTFDYSEPNFIVEGILNRV